MRGGFEAVVGFAERTLFVRGKAQVAPLDAPVGGRSVDGDAGGFGDPGPGIAFGGVEPAAAGVDGDEFSITPDVLWGPLGGEGRGLRRERSPSGPVDPGTGPG